jgi:hypothetical protein
LGLESLAFDFISLAMMLSFVLLGDFISSFFFKFEWNVRLLLVDIVVVAFVWAVLYQVVKAALFPNFFLAALASSCVALLSVVAAGAALSATALRPRKMPEPTEDLTARVERIERSLALMEEEIMALSRDMRIRNLEREMDDKGSN